jgi:orotidine-5'-phosphate decarboxylase
VGAVEKLMSDLTMKLKTPLMVALDVDDEARCLALADQLSDVAGAFKIGPRLLLRYGSSLISKLATRAPVFVDCKFFDIPSTMEASVRACFDSGASFATVHALAGPTALARLAGLEAELNRTRSFKILCVSILTSWDENEFSNNFKTQDVNTHVQDLASQVKASGLTGLVCSPHEIELLKTKNLFLVTPGIRLESVPNDDQKRVMTPELALKAGASAFVVGRPILEAEDPLQTAMDFVVPAYE